ncbi:P-loop NTPase [Candidatus Woesearchaeota archaeon]|nr:P-loop NTPase [Candidatus Woesearchaeota archaeon]
MSNLILVRGNAGQGKSTVALNLAFALKHFGYDVLLVDADTKNPRLGHYLGMPLVQNTVQAVLSGRLELSKSIYQLPNGVKALFSSINEDAAKHPSTFLDAVKQYSTLVIVDCSNDAQWDSVNGEHLIVVEPDFPSGLSALKIKKSTNARYCVVNRARAPQLPTQNIEEITHTRCLARINEDLLIREASLKGHSVLDYEPNCASSEAFKQLAANLMNLEYSPSAKKEPLLARLGIL